MRIKIRLAVAAVAVIASAALPWATGVAHAVPSIDITSPNQGQTFAGNDLTVSGTTDPNSTVLVLASQKVLKQTISDATGQWSAELKGLPSGSNTITAKVVKSKGEAYFVSYDGQDAKINQMRLSDNAINTSGTWPIVMSSMAIGMVPSPAENIFYGFASALVQSAIPVKFDANDPQDPVDTSGYPSNPAASKGDFTADGTKLYIPNINGNTVSVVDVATNAWEKDISLSTTPLRVDRNPVNGKLHVTGGSVNIIDPTNDSVSQVSGICNGQPVMSTTFSTDLTYQYYFVYCTSENSIQKLRISDNTLVDTFNIGGTPTGGVTSADSSKLYINANATQNDSIDADKLRVMNTDTGEITQTIQLTDGAVGILSSPDYQNLYIPTPSSNFTVNNMDVVNMTTFEVEQITLPPGEGAIVVSASPVNTSDIANVNVGVVLGVGDAASTGKLASTGMVIWIVSAVAGTVILVSLLYTYADYRRHRKPLVEADPHASQTYTYRHHMSTVTIPLLRYRVSITLSRQPSGITRF